MSGSPPDFSQELARYQMGHGQYYFNLSHNVLILSEDKARLLLLAHLSRMASREAWLAPAGILATVLATFATTTFRDFVLDAATWRALFIFAALSSGAWLAWRLWTQRSSPTLDDLVGALKAASDQQRRA